MGRGHVVSLVWYDARRDRIVMFAGIGSVARDDYRNDTWEWNGRSWVMLADTSIGTRDHHAMIYDPTRGVVLMHGGVNRERQHMSDTWSWNGESWRKVSSSGPQPRNGAAMTYDARAGALLLFGGTTGSQHLNDLWQWDGIDGMKLTFPIQSPAHELALCSFTMRDAAVPSSTAAGTGRADK